MKSAALDG
jgi:hypothetical protein